ncbi:hypothetical protein KA001_00955 [Patescibacteria group bacterium]|nr:hypothetical protein [Patescibacteria group bacterium]
MINYETNIEPPTPQSISELNYNLAELGFYVDPTATTYSSNTLPFEQTASNCAIENNTCMCDITFKSGKVERRSSWSCGTSASNNNIGDPVPKTETSPAQIKIVTGYNGVVIAERPKTTAGTGTQLTLPSGESASGIAYPIIMAACLVPMCYVIGKMVVSAIKSVMDSED